MSQKFIATLLGRKTRQLIQVCLGSAIAGISVISFFEFGVAGFVSSLSLGLFSLLAVKLSLVALMQARSHARQLRQMSSADEASEPQAARLKEFADRLTLLEATLDRIEYGGDSPHSSPEIAAEVAGLIHEMAYVREALERLRADMER